MQAMPANSMAMTGPQQPLSPAYHATMRQQYQTLLEGFASLKPKKRSSPIAWIFVGAMVFFMGGLAADASIRESVFSPKVAEREPMNWATVSTPVVARNAPPPVQVTARAQAQAQAQAPMQAQPATTPTTPPVAMVAAPSSTAAEPAPVTHAKAHHGAPTQRAHSRTRRAK